MDQRESLTPVNVATGVVPRTPVDCEKAKIARLLLSWLRTASHLPVCDARIRPRRSRGIWERGTYLVERHTTRVTSSAGGDTNSGHGSGCGRRVELENSDGAVVGGDRVTVGRQDVF